MNTRQFALALREHVEESSELIVRVPRSGVETVTDTYLLADLGGGGAWYYFEARSIDDSRTTAGVYAGPRKQIVIAPSPTNREEGFEERLSRWLHRAR